MPAPGEHPDSRRDRQVTADVELEYLYGSWSSAVALGRCYRWMAVISMS